MTHCVTDEQAETLRGLGFMDYGSGDWTHETKNLNIWWDLRRQEYVADGIPSASAFDSSHPRFQDPIAAAVYLLTLLATS